MKSNYEQRLTALARTGRSARAVGAILRNEGYDVSDSTVGRRMAIVLGPQRSTARTRTPSTRKAPTGLVARILIDWINAQPDPAEAEERVHASLAEYFAAPAAPRESIDTAGSAPAVTST